MKRKNTYQDNLKYSSKNTKEKIMTMKINGDTYKEQFYIFIIGNDTIVNNYKIIRWVWSLRMGIPCKRWTMSGPSSMCNTNMSMKFLIKINILRIYKKKGIQFQQQPELNQLIHIVIFGALTISETPDDSIFGNPERCWNLHYILKYFWKVGGGEGWRLLRSCYCEQ